MLNPSPAEIADFLEWTIECTEAIEGQVSVLRAIASRDNTNHQDLDKFLNELVESTAQRTSKPKKHEENARQNKVD